MKPNGEDDDEMPVEYDFSKLKRIPDPFFQKFQDLNLVSLDNDVREAFPDSASVNKALREWMKAHKEASAETPLPKAS